MGIAGHRGRSYNSAVARTGIWVRVLVALGLIVLVSGGQALAARQPQPVSALSTLPAPAKPLPSDLKLAIGRAADHIGVSPRTALNGTRLLRSNVTGLPLYAFGGGKALCFIVWRGVGTCGDLNAPTSVLWAVNGGSKKRGQAVVGIVPDAVVAVRVRVNNSWHVVTPVHNAFYFPYHVSPNSSGTVAVAAQTH
jgi:hypothetical protein